MAKTTELNGVEYDVLAKEGEYMKLGFGDQNFWYKDGHKFQKKGRGFVPARGTLPGQPRGSKHTQKNAEPKVASTSASKKTTKNENAAGIPELLLSRLGDVTVREIVDAVAATRGNRATVVKPTEGAAGGEGDTLEVSLPNPMLLLAQLHKMLGDVLSRTATQTPDGEGYELPALPFTSFHANIIEEGMKKQGKSASEVVNDAYRGLAIKLGMNADFIDGAISTAEELDCYHLNQVEQPASETPAN